MSKKYWCSISMEARGKCLDGIYQRLYAGDLRRLLCKISVNSTTRIIKPITCPVSLALGYWMFHSNVQMRTHTLSRESPDTSNSKNCIKSIVPYAVSDFGSLTDISFSPRALGSPLPTLYLQSTTSVVINFGILCGASLSKNSITN